MRQLPFDAYDSITRVLDPQSPIVAIDVGAHHGSMVRRLLEVFPRASVHAFEPAPATCEELRKNCGAMPNVRIYPLAAGDREGSVTFHETGDNFCSSVLAPSDVGKSIYGDRYRTRRSIEVGMVRLDDWARQQGVAKVDFLKLDAQGFELSVLRGAKELLARGITAINSEAQLVPEYVGASTFSEIELFLRDAGYTLHQVHELVTHGPVMQSSYLDALWLHNDALRALRERPVAVPPTAQMLAMRRALEACERDGLRRVAIYGAGQHTRAVGEVLMACRRPAVVAIVDDDRARSGQEVAGLPIVTPESIPGLGLDALVLSSDAHEPALWQRTAPLRERGLRVVTLYGGEKPGAVAPRAIGTTANAPQAPEARTTKTDDVHAPPDDHIPSARSARRTRRALEHVASLELPLRGKRVLLLDNGVVENARFFLDRGCRVHTGVARSTSLDRMLGVLGGVEGFSAGLIDVEDPRSVQAQGSFDMVFCSGILHCLRQPARALGTLAAACTGVLLLDTYVVYGEHEALYRTPEGDSPEAIARHTPGAWPTRPWLWAHLRRDFPHAFVPRKQPAHEEYPTDWSTPRVVPFLHRAVFVASRSPMDSALLDARLPIKQESL